MALLIKIYKIMFVLLHPIKRGLIFNVFIASPTYYYLNKNILHCVKPHEKKLQIKIEFYEDKTTLIIKRNDRQYLC